MREITGNLWNHYRQPNTVILLTTNGFVKKDGKAVMGRGCAAEAVRYIPDVQHYLAEHIRVNGNHE